MAKPLIAVQLVLLLVLFAKRTVRNTACIRRMKP